jgi:hypothetical protein
MYAGERQRFAVGRSNSDPVRIAVEEGSGNPSTEQRWKVRYEGVEETRIPCAGRRTDERGSAKEAFQSTKGVGRRWSGGKGCRATGDDG